MSRTFSLKLLMLVITLLCIACGLAVNYPSETFEIALFSTLFIPTGTIVLTLVHFSRQRWFTLLASVFGALCFAVLFSSPIMSPPIRTLWQAYMNEVFPMSVFPPLGALLLGGSILADEIRLRRKNLSDNEVEN